MLKLFIILHLAVITTHANSQIRSSNEIVAEGGAKTRVKPDIAILSLIIEKNDSIEKEAIRNLNIQTAEVVTLLSKIGFTDDLIQIERYDVSSGIDDKNKREYTASNTLRIEFKINNKLIDAFFDEMQQTGVQDVNVSFDTKVSDSLEKSSGYDWCSSR